jgi:uncharacterized HAD superfamily protein
MKGKPKLAVDIDETVVYLLGYFLDHYNDKHDTRFREEDFYTYRWWDVLGITKEQAYKEAEDYIKTKMRRYEDTVPSAWYRHPTLDEKDWLTLTEDERQEIFDLYLAANERARREGRFEQGYGDFDCFGIEFVEGSRQALNLLYFFYDLYSITDRNTILDLDTEAILCCLFIHDEADMNYFPQFKAESEDGGEILILPYEKVIHTQIEGKTKAQICVEANIGTIVEDNADTALECAEQGIQVVVLARPWNVGMPKHPLISRMENWQEACNLLVPGNIELPDADRGEYI